MWSVVVEESGSGRELARYTYDRKEEAQAAQRDVKAVRIAQNHERVRVKLVREQ